MKKNIIFQKGKYFYTFNHFYSEKSSKKSKIAQSYYYDPQSTRINVQSPQSESPPKRLTLLVPNYYFNNQLIHVWKWLNDNQKYHFTLTEKPDLGGKEADDNRLLCEAEDSNMSCVVNAPGTLFWQSVFYDNFWDLMFWCFIFLYYYRCLSVSMCWNWVRCIGCQYFASKSSCDRCRR